MTGTEVGKRMVVLAGADRGVIETGELTQRRVLKVGEPFAYDEGEGERTLLIPAGRDIDP